MSGTVSLGCTRLNTPRIARPESATFKTQNSRPSAARPPAADMDELRLWPVDWDQRLFNLGHLNELGICSCDAFYNVGNDFKICYVHNPPRAR